MKTPEEIIAGLAAEGRVCPQPTHWNELWEMLPNRRRAGSGWEPALPLILAAWHNTSDTEKSDRLLLHLKWAESHGALKAVASYLATLKPDNWHLAIQDY